MIFHISIATGWWMYLLMLFSNGAAVFAVHISSAGHGAMSERDGPIFRVVTLTSVSSTSPVSASARPLFLILLASVTGRALVAGIADGEPCSCLLPS